MARPQGLFILDHSAFDLAYGPAERAEVAELVDVYAPPQTHASVLANPALLADADVILSGWGGPTLDEPFLDHAPRLKAMFYAGGALGPVLTPAAWARGITITSSIEANAIPVAEYTLATLLFSLKHGWRLTSETRRQRRFVDRDSVPGCFGSTIGIISLGSIARALLKLLAPFDLHLLAYDPFLTDADAQRLGVERVSLEELFRRSDVATLHTPLLPETEALITGAHLASMKRGATFINTARGEIVCEAEMIEVATRRPDLQFVLDVTAPEPPEADSPLYTLPNVVLTPHIAGSAGTECRRMGKYMVEELKRYVAGKPLRWSVTPEMTRHTSHRPGHSHKPPGKPKRSAALTGTTDGIETR